MKICFITNTVFNLGGVQRVVSVLANQLSENCEVDILCTNDEICIKRDLYNLSPKVNVKLNGNLFSEKVVSKVVRKIFRKINSITGFFNNNKMKNVLLGIYYPNEVRNNFIEYLNSKKYDVVIGVEGYYSLLVAIISNELAAKTIGWQHNSYEAYFKTRNNYYWRQDELFKEYINKLDRYVVLTEDDKRKMKNHLNIDCKRIYNPLSFISKCKAECRNKNIICVGRLVQEQKGFDLLIKAFSKVAVNNKEWKLKIVGDGPDKEKINQLIQTLNLRNQISMEPFTKKIKKKYLESSIFVSASRWEGFGLVITEAMECGLPVIAFANSGPKEIINRPNQNGILVPRGDIDALAKMMVNLIKNEEKRKEMSKESIKRANDFSIDIIINQWNEIINI
ncbi:glycosyltransferase family 4 protein [Clostridium sp. CM027]|nr:glycosyltransferase family 4 protein [Clostridium sp. CM027]MBW9145260.1 glycosyltransferase family 4 protein [Clostridium sp. CM027]UVE42740.1 glycosyltransferase family 4 protein [Clostridium sp. CM027]